MPVIPVGLSGSYDAGQRWADVVRRNPVTLRVGKPQIWSGRYPVQVIDDAITSLIAGWAPSVHLASLPL